MPNHPAIQPRNVALMFLAGVPTGIGTALVLSAVAPGWDGTLRLSLGAGFGAALLVYRQRVHENPRAPWTEHVVTPGRALAGLLIVAVGATITTLSSLVLLAVVTDWREGAFTFALIPAGIAALGVGIIYAGARLRRPRDELVLILKRMRTRKQRLFEAKSAAISDRRRPSPQGTDADSGHFAPRTSSRGSPESPHSRRGAWPPRHHRKLEGARRVPVAERDRNTRSTPVLSEHPSR